MRMRKIAPNRTLKSAAAEFLAFKRAQIIRERTLHDYQKYINPFIEQSSNSMDIDVLKRELLEYFANIPATSPARYNHPYQYRRRSLRYWTSSGCCSQPPTKVDQLSRFSSSSFRQIATAQMRSMSCRAAMKEL